MNYLIITNNPLVQSQYPAECIISEEHYINVLMTVRNHIHNGARLLSHPQAGSIKPYETLYRSILVSHTVSNLDFDSLQHIENAIERFETLSNSMGMREYNDRILKDFQVVDAGLVASAISSINQ